MSTVALTDIIILSPWQYDGTSGTIRWFYSEDFLDDTNGFVMGGDGLTGFYFESDFTVVGGLPVCDGINLIATANSRKPTVTLSAQFFDSNGTPRNFLFTNWSVPGNSTLTFAQLEIYNEAATVSQPLDAWLTRDEIYALLAALPIPPTGISFKSSDYASLAAAVTAIGTTRGTLLIEAANFSSGASITVPSTLVIDWGGIGSLLLTTGHVVTINSDASQYPVRKLFNNALAGQGTVKGPTSIWWEWWGAVGDDVTDDTGAAQAGITAIEAVGGGTVNLGRKTYVIAGPLQDVLASASQLVLPRVAPAQPMISIHFQGVTPVNILTEDEVSQIRSTLDVEKTFTASAATNALTVTASPFVNGQVVWVRNSGGALPGNLAPLTFYYVRDKDVEGVNTFKLATTPSGGAIDLSSNGTGSNFVGPFGSLIGGRPVNGVGTGSQNEIAHNAMNWITFTAANVGFRVPENPTINGVDLRFIPTSRFDDCRIDVSGIDVTLSSGVVPDLAVTEPVRPTYGLLGPLAYIPNLCQINNLLILGYWTCVRWGELMSVSYMEIGACKVGIEMRQGTHASSAQKLLFVSTASILEMKGVDPFFGGVADADVYNPIDIQQFDWENAVGAGSMAWTTTTSIISDVNNQLHGDIKWISLFPMVKTGGANLRLHQTNRAQHLYRPFSNITGTDLGDSSSDHAVWELSRGLPTSGTSKLPWILLTTKQSGTDQPVGLLTYNNDQIADGLNKILGMVAAVTHGAINRGKLDFYTADPSGVLSIRTSIDSNGNLINAGMLLFGEGPALTVSGNAIAPTFRYHAVGAGLIKNITLPAGPGAGVVHEVIIFPTAAFTWDTTGNIGGSGGTASIGVPIIATWWPSAAKWTLK